jgi:hypothetical protein
MVIVICVKIIQNIVQEMQSLLSYELANVNLQQSSILREPQAQFSSNLQQITPQSEN